jgi:Zn-dependent protease
MDLFVLNIVHDPRLFISWVFIVTFSICLHEFSHAWMALMRGDTTAADEGHLSLNPMVQMGSMSLVLLCVIGIAWGAVPVNPARFRRAWDAALVAFAGPLSNLLLCLLASLLAVLFSGTEEISYFFRLGAWVNGVLFLLNMLPVPMLDGWTVLAFFFPGMSRMDASKAQQVSLFALVIIFVTPVGDFIWDGGLAMMETSMRFFSFLI